MKNEDWLLLQVVNRVAFAQPKFYLFLVPYAAVIAVVASIYPTICWVLAVVHAAVYATGSIVTLLTKQIIKLIYVEGRVEPKNPKAGLEILFFAILLAAFGAWGAIGAVFAGMVYVVT